MDGIILEEGMWESMFDRIRDLLALEVQRSRYPAAEPLKAHGSNHGKIIGEQWKTTCYGKSTPINPRYQRERAQHL
jgi:hypothetical protein